MHIAGAIREPIFLDDIMVFHDIALVFGGEEGVINKGLADVALYDAWLNSKGDPVKYDALTYYNLILNHPFTNANKRTATLTAYTILYINHYELAAKNEELVELALKVASGRISKDNIVKWFKKHGTKMGDKNNIVHTKLPREPEKRREILKKIAWKIVKKKKKVFEELAKY